MNRILAGARRQRVAIAPCSPARARGVAVAGLFGAGIALAPSAAALPPGFTKETAVDGLSKPTAMAIAPDGRVFVSELAGLVKVVQDGALLGEPLLNLVDEVGASDSRGVLGLALDPEFSKNGFLYLYFVVDPVFGQPDEPPTATFCRLVRYTVGLKGDPNVVDLDSRLVLLGNDATDGTISCHITHQGGGLAFGLDGSLFLGTGDAAGFYTADGGGDVSCGQMFGQACNVGAFRAQNLDCLAGKILRIDPATGQGVPSNPYWTGDPNETRSKVWAYGLRNPYRISVRPGTGGSNVSGTLYIGDVGWNLYEEIDVCHGGENFGWPCREGPIPLSIYSNLNPPNSGCATIGTPANPGPLVGPAAHWHHSAPELSSPPGVKGRCTIGGVFYWGGSFPAAYDGAYFAPDFTANWLRVVEFDANDAVITSTAFGSIADGPLDIAVEPATGDLLVLCHDAGGRIDRIRYVGGDLTDDGVVDGGDLGFLLGVWGQSGSPADLDGSGSVDAGDIALLLSEWSA